MHQIPLDSARGAAVHLEELAARLGAFGRVHHARGAGFRRDALELELAGEGGRRRRRDDGDGAAGDGGLCRKQGGARRPRRGVDAKTSAASPRPPRGADYAAASTRPAQVVIKDTYFEENHATTAGGAIAVVATSSTATFPGKLKLEGLSAILAGTVDAADGPKTGGSFLKMNGGDLSMSAMYVGEMGLGLRYVAGKLDFTDGSGVPVVDVRLFVADNVKLTISDCEADADPTYVHSTSGEFDVPFKGFNDDGFFNIKCV